jgi:hypothetical protein
MLLERISTETEFLPAPSSTGNSLFQCKQALLAFQTSRIPR